MDPTHVQLWCKSLTIFWAPCIIASAKNCIVAFWLSYPFLHLLSKHGSEQNHEGIEYSSRIVVVECFEPSRHAVLQQKETVHECETEFGVFSVRRRSRRRFSTHFEILR